jgi:uncharacterized protein
MQVMTGMGSSAMNCALYTLAAMRRQFHASLRLLWLLAGWLALLLGMLGIFLPLLPTTPFVLLAAWCFARGSARCEAWLLNHRRFGPLVRDWRERRAVPLRAKQLAVLTMALSSVYAATRLPNR